MRDGDGRAVDSDDGGEQDAGQGRWQTIVSSRKFWENGSRDAQAGNKLGVFKGREGRGVPLTRPGGFQGILSHTTTPRTLNAKKTAAYTAEHCLRASRARRDGTPKTRQIARYACSPACL